VPLVALVHDPGGFAWLFVVLAALAGVSVTAALSLQRDGSGPSAVPVPAPAE
jgi:hypothetical protein